ncbi:MAG: hypothetical protein ACI8T1_003207, partial [Verrucomicrobiales bacterium]
FMDGWFFFVFGALPVGGAPTIHHSYFNDLLDVSRFLPGVWRRDRLRQNKFSSLVPSGMTPYFLTVNGGHLYLAIFNHGSPGTGDAILRFSPSPGFSIISAEHDPIADTITLTWDSNEGEVFEVHKSLDLDSWVAVEMQIPAAAAPSQTTTAIVDHNVGESKAFYRVARLAGEE